MVARNVFDSQSSLKKSVVVTCTDNFAYQYGVKTDMKKPFPSWEKIFYDFGTNLRTFRNANEVGKSY